MECNLFYVLTLLMVLSGGVSIVVLIYGEIDVLYLFEFFKIFDCVSFFTFANFVTIYGFANLGMVYLVFLTIYEVFKMMRGEREESDFFIFGRIGRNEVVIFDHEEVEGN